MAELLAAIVAFPAVVPTVLLGVALLYWLMVLLGAVDIDLLGGEGVAEGALDGAGEGAAHALLPGIDGAAEGAIDGAAEGAADAALHGIADGAAEGALHGVADGAAEGALHGVADGAAEGALHGGADGVAEGGAHAASHAASHAIARVHSADGALGVTVGERAAGNGTRLLSASNFRSVPVTVAASALIAFTWLLTVLGGRLAATVAPVMPGWLLGTAVLLASALIALLPTAVAVRPLGRFFVVHAAKSHADLVGRVCRINTGTVGPKFGQAELQGEDLHLIVQVRHDTDTVFRRGDRALIVAWDPRREAFLVEPYDKLLGPDARSL